QLRTLLRSHYGATMMAAPDACGVARLRVLVAEDEADTAFTTAFLLDRAGHEVHIAATGPQALERAAAEPPDVVLLDLGLPGLDGYRVAERIRALGLAPRPLLIAISGYGAELDRQRSAAAGIDLHLVKPADPELLLGLLRRFAGLARHDGPRLADAPRRTRPSAPACGSTLLELSDRLRAESLTDHVAALRRRSVEL